MQKNTLIGLGVGVVVLTAWLVVAVAYKGVSGENTVIQESITPTEVSTEAAPAADDSLVTGTAEVETTVTIPTEEVTTTVVVEEAE